MKMIWEAYQVVNELCDWYRSYLLACSLEQLAQEWAERTGEDAEPVYDADGAGFGLVSEMPAAPAYQTITDDQPTLTVGRHPDDCELCDQLLEECLAEGSVN